MNDETIDLVLEHFGTKGMHWGVRRAEKQTEKIDKLFEKSAGDVRIWVAVNNRAAQLTNDHDIDRINNKPKYKGMNFNDENAPLTKQYTKEHQDAWIKNLNRAATELGTNASGTKKYSIAVDPSDRWLWGVTTSDIQHIDEIMVVRVNHDKNGRITSLETVSPMEHSGVKGMHWGVRKAPRQSSSDFKKTSNLRNRKTRELSNKQLQSVNARINMEQQYRRLNPTKIKTGQNMAKGIIAALGTAASLYTLANSPAGKAGIAAAKKMLVKKV
jgi:hypothetical protein